MIKNGNMMGDTAISILSLGKMYKLYRRPADKVLDAFGINQFLAWRKNYYQEFWALRDLNLEVKKGERLGIIGRNGAGKSTLLKIICSNVAPTEGKVMVQGRIQALMELGTGFHPEFTGRQNIHASLAYQGLSYEHIRKKEEEIIDFAELDNFIDQPVKTYSAGMYARLAFSTATSIEPDILIVDEVLGAGDAYFAGKSLERMRKLTEESGATVLFVSHDLGSVQQMCQRVIWIDRGRVMADGQPLKVTKAYYASILEQEEKRLRARNTRLTQRQKGETVQNEIIPDYELLGRLVISDETSPHLSHPIRRLTLTSKDGFQLVLEPGTPMDNDQTQQAYLLTDPHYMNWSEPRLSEGVRVRYFENTGGKYRHAPFIFKVPGDQWEKGELKLEIEHATQDGEIVRVEIFNGQTYDPIGMLKPSSGKWYRQSWSLLSLNHKMEEGTPSPNDSQIKANNASTGENVKSAELIKSPESPPEAEVLLEQKTIDKYYSEYADFLEIEIINKTGQPRVIFGLGESIGIRATALIRKDIPVCGFSVTVYTLNGVVMANLFWPFSAGLTAGAQTWSVFIQVPNLRQGEYVISCGIIKEFLTSSNEVILFYCRWSRALSFRVDEGFIGNMPLGVVWMNTEPPVGSALSAIAQVGAQRLEQV